MRNLRVLDMSHYQTVSNLDGMKAAGIVGVIHKATEGTSVVDAKYATRRAWFLENGFAFASYHFLQHGGVEAQMRHYLDVAAPEDGEVVILDYEAAGLTLDDLETAVACLRVDAPSNPICIYGGSLLEEHVGSQEIEWLTDTTLWTAEYTTRDAPKWPTATWPKWSLWQYSDGKAGGTPNDVSGVSQVDCNEFNGTDEECRAWFKETAKVEPVPAPVLTVEDRLTALEIRIADMETLKADASTLSALQDAVYDMQVAKAETSQQR